MGLEKKIENNFLADFCREHVVHFIECDKKRMNGELSHIDKTEDYSAIFLYGSDAGTLESLRALMKTFLDERSYDNNIIFLPGENIDHLKGNKFYFINVGSSFNDYQSRMNPQARRSQPFCR